jgi:carbonic anhydrase
MRRLSLGSLVLLAVALPCLASEDDGADLCRVGRSQSPIAIESLSALPTELQTPAPDYRASAVVLWNVEGHTVQVQFASSHDDAGPGDNRLWVDGVSFRLVQLHFHRPGEHSIDKQVPVMELHLVHEDSSHHLAVLAVPIMVVEDSAGHPAIGELWSALPEGKDERRLLPRLFNPASLLPASRVAYLYPGSLTTGDCAESVRWTVFGEPIAISRAQLAKYESVFHGDYARPVQPAYGRIPLRSTP